MMPSNMLVELECRTVTSRTFPFCRVFLHVSCCCCYYISFYVLCSMCYSLCQLNEQAKPIAALTAKIDNLAANAFTESTAAKSSDKAVRYVGGTNLPERTAPTEATTAGSTASYRTAVPAWSADRNAGGTCRATNPEGGTADIKSAAIDTFGMPGELREYRSPSGHNLIPGEEALTGRLCQKPTEHTGTASTATGSSAVTYIVPPNPIIMRGDIGQIAL